MYYTREYLNRAHREIDTIFRVLFPEHGMAVREEQIMLCHKMLDNLLGRNIALCDAGVGIGKTYAYLVACVLMRKYSLLAEGCSPYEQRPVVISTSSIALQKAILTEYIPFLSRILQENGTIQAPIKAVIRKGKEHFVCDERLEHRIVAIEEKNKNALQKEALLSLKEHYDMDEVSNLSGFDRSSVRETARKEAHAGISSIWSVPEIMKCSFRSVITIICWLMVITGCRITARY